MLYLYSYVHWVNLGGPNQNKLFENTLQCSKCMLKKGFDNSVLHEDFVILDNNSKSYKLYSIPQVRQVFFYNGMN